MRATGVTDSPIGDIVRDPEAASREAYDLIVIGAGVYGIMLTLEASLRGLSVLLLEKGDFGEVTSFNSLRIVHGGFRYLQNLDLPRYFESVAEQRWFLRHFPDAVLPLSCLMPLYGKGLRRPHLLAMGLTANAILGAHRNIGVRPDRRIRFGAVLNRSRTFREYPRAIADGLKGGAIWHDAYMPDSQKLMIQILRVACGNGATALNYLKAEDLIKEGDRSVGVVAIDQTDGAEYRFPAGKVVNAAGPWCREVAARFDRDEPSLFQGVLVWNLLLDKPALCKHAVAVAPPGPGKQHTYFLVPWKGLVFAGTGHAPWHKTDNGRPEIPSERMAAFLDDINRAVPGLDASERDVIRVFPGVQPGSRPGGTELASREVFIDHGRTNGPEGLYSISGVKLTTARQVAEDAVRYIFPDRPPVRPMPVVSDNGFGRFDRNWSPDETNDGWMTELQSIISSESVVHLDDLVVRRTTLWENPERTLEMVGFLCRLFDWDEGRACEETARLKISLQV